MKVHHGSKLIIIYDRHLFFSPFLFLFFDPLPPVFLFFLVIIYAYHYQSVKAILLLGPVSRGRCFRLRSPFDLDVTNSPLLVYQLVRTLLLVIGWQAGKGLLLTQGMCYL